MGLGDAALATKLALLFIFLGFIVHIIGFGAPYWQILGSTDLYHGGLWQICILGHCQDFNTDQLTNIGFDNWFQAVRTFECFGVIGSIAVIVFVALYICVGTCSGSKCIAILNVILCFATGGVILIAIIIYGSKKDGLDWAYGLTTAGGVSYIIAGIFIIISMRSN